MKETDLFLQKHHHIGLDSNILITFFERKSTYHKQTVELFQGFERHHNQLWLSVLSIPEIQSKPFSMGELHIAAAYEAALFYSDFTFAPIEISTARIASKIAGHYRMKVMDSLVIASLFESEATGFITADKYLKKIEEMDVLLVS